MLSRLLGLVTGLSLESCGVIVSLAALMVGLYFVQKLLIPEGLVVEKRVAVALAFSPMALFFYIGYSESLFLMLCAMFFYFLRDRRFLAAGLVGALAALTRNSGVLLCIPLIFQVLSDLVSWEQIRKTPGPWRKVRKVFASLKGRPAVRYLPALHLLWIAAGLLGYMGFCAIRFGDPLSFATVQTQFGRDGFLPPYETLWRGLSYNLNKIAFSGDGVVALYYLSQVAILSLALLLLAWGVTRAPFGMWLFAALSLVMPLCMPSTSEVVDYFISFSRYSMCLLPMTIYAQSLFGRREAAWNLYLVLSTLCMVMSVYGWSQGYFLA